MCNSSEGKIGASLHGVRGVRRGALDGSHRDSLGDGFRGFPLLRCFALEMKTRFAHEPGIQYWMRKKARL